MTLDQAKRGDLLEVLTLGSGPARAKMLRLGISEGCEITCILKVPAGPLVVREGAMEVAVGRKTASEIRVKKSNA